MTTQLLLRVCFLNLLLFSGALFGQNDESSGLLGDNFSLESALEAFKDATSLAAFEEEINKKDNHIHNLDLNGDGDIDYVQVNDHREKDVHAIVLSAVVAKNESQDIAVIEIEKTGTASATLQIVGDPDLYGEDMIVEPYDIEGDSEGRGPNENISVKKVIFNVWLWPSVRYIYGPSYVVYYSPWSWSYYPVWWRPWRPLTWNVWRPYRIQFAPRYRLTPVRRVSHAHVVYRPHRKVSRTVTVKHKTSVTKARSHKVHASKSKTTVAKVNTKNGNKVAATKTTTRVKNSNGTQKKASKTKVKATNGKKTVKAGKKTTTKKSKKGKVKKSKKGKVKKTKKAKKKKG